MSIKYAIINEPSVPVYADTEGFVINEEGHRISTVADEGLYGTICRILDEQEGWFHIISAYGYSGYVESARVLIVDEAGMKAWQGCPDDLGNVQADGLADPNIGGMAELAPAGVADPGLCGVAESDMGSVADPDLAGLIDPMTAGTQGPMITTGICTDVLSAPTLHGECLITLPRGSVVKYLDSSEEGYSLVGLADGRTGYVVSNRLGAKWFGEELLDEDPAVLMERQATAVEKREFATGGSDKFGFKAYLDRWYTGTPEEQEAAFRSLLTETAKSYLGVQYRWGGRSSFGIDCSGLTHLSYMLCGILIYRDASIVDGYPLKRLDLKWNDGHFDLSNLDGDAMKPGDALYFPGHVAIYMGDGLYLHSTGKAGDMGVVYNSLRPEHPLFREDLLEKLYAVAGLRL